MTGWPTTICIIRHGEKPVTGDPDKPAKVPAHTPVELQPTTFGIDSQGTFNPDSLTPRGWQRAGALAVLFGKAPIPTSSEPNGPPTLARPDLLFAPLYDTASNQPDANEHRAYETIQPLCEVLDGLSRASGGPGMEIHAHHQITDTVKAMTKVLESGATTALVAWEHHNIYVQGTPPVPSTGLVAALDAEAGVANIDEVPACWLGDRFDVIWCFQLGGDARYTFSQIPQLLLAQDSADPMSCAKEGPK
jgi:hypothetical protein